MLKNAHKLNPPLFCSPHFQTISKGEITIPDKNNPSYTKTVISIEGIPTEYDSYVLASDIHHYTVHFECHQIPTGTFGMNSYRIGHKNGQFLEIVI
jgi:hypothetical protein